MKYIQKFQKMVKTNDINQSKLYRFACDILGDNAASRASKHASRFFGKDKRACIDASRRKRLWEKSLNYTVVIEDE